MTEKRRNAGAGVWLALSVHGHLRFEARGIAGHTIARVAWTLTVLQCGVRTLPHVSQTTLRGVRSCGQCMNNFFSELVRQKNALPVRSPQAYRALSSRDRRMPLSIACTTWRRLPSLRHHRDRQRQLSLQETKLKHQKHKNRGSTPKGYPSITVPSASYAVGFLPGLGISPADAADCAWLTIKTLVNVGRRKLVSLGRRFTVCPRCSCRNAVQSCSATDPPRPTRRFTSRLTPCELSK
jgi:hypothetical protein